MNAAPASQRARGRASALGFVFLLVACQDAPPLGPNGSPREMLVAPLQNKAQPIVSGAAAPDESSVFFLEVTLPSGVATCTATLVTPDLLLTAAHCVTGQFSAVDCVETHLQGPLPLDSFRVSNEPDLTGAPQDDWEFSALSDARVVFEGQTLCGRDVALLRLQNPVSASVATPVAVPREGLASSGVSPIEYRAIGYGAVHPSGTGERVRRVSDALSIACDSPFTCDDFMSIGAAGSTSIEAPTIQEAEWIGRGAGCPGDSGGPALMPIDGTQAVVGVLSRGRSDCSLNIYTSPQSAEFRAAARDMIETHDSAPTYEIPSWLQEPRPPDPTISAGGMGGGGAAPSEPPAQVGGATDEVPSDRESTRASHDEPGCSCRASGSKGRGSKAPVAFLISFLVLWGARRRPTGARAEVRR